MRQTRHKPLNRLTPHAYKATQATQSTQATQTHTTTTNRAKNALKRETRPYSKTTHQRQSSKADKRTERTTRGPAPNVWQVLKPQRAYTPAQVDTINTAKQSRRNLHHLHPHFKNIFRFCPFLSPIFPRLDKIKQINVYF